MTRKVVLLTPVEEFMGLAQKVRALDPTCDIQYAENEKKLRECIVNFQLHDRLIAYATSVIIPPDILDGLPTPAYNFHNGPPEHPGIFPACFAICDGAVNFGATVHEVTKEVNQGPIVGVEMSAISPKIERGHLEGLGQILLGRLLKRVLPVVLDKVLKPPRLELEWSKTVPRKPDYDALFNVSENIDRAEFERRLRAIGERPGRTLRTQIHGRFFQLVPLPKARPKDKK